MAYTSFTPKVQADGSPLQWTNCNPTAGANVAISDQRGVRPTKGSPWPPTGGSVRKATGDTSGGTNLAQIDSALSRTYGALEIDLDVRYKLPIGEFVRLIGTVGKPAVLQGASIATRGTIWQGSETFAGNHSWSVYDHRGSWPNGETLIHDPLWDGRRKSIPDNKLRWIPDRYVVAFAKNLDLDGQGHLLGPGLVYAAFGDAWLPPTPPAGVTYRYGGEPRRRGMKVVDSSRARLRRSPYAIDGNVLRSVPKGFLFRARQSTEKGSVAKWQEGGKGPVLRSSIWYGDATGRVWIHISCVDAVK